MSLFPFANLYKQGLSAFVSINIKHRNRFGADPYLILELSSNQSYIHRKTNGKEENPIYLT